MNDPHSPRVLVVGLGKLGLPMAAVFADSGLDVIGADAVPAVVDAVARGTYPKIEPGVADLIQANPFRVSQNIEAVASISDVAFIVVPTPSGSNDRFDASMVIDAARRVATGFRARDPEAPRPTVVVVSTVMPGTCATVVADAIAEAAPGVDVGLAYHPEFIALGSVVGDLRGPSVVYLGADDDAAATALWSVLRRVVRSGTPTVRLTLVEAEIAKLAVNVYLSVKIGYANEVAALCHEFGADPAQVLDAVGSDGRIGTGYFRNGAPPSGPCLPRDLRAWANLLPSPFVDASHQSAAAVLNRAAGDLWSASTVGVLGLAYKPGSNIADESFGWRIAQRVAEDGKAVIVHDPYVATAPPGCTWGALADVLACDAVVIGCDHPEYHAVTHAHLVRP